MEKNLLFTMVAKAVGCFYLVHYQIWKAIFKLYYNRANPEMSRNYSANQYEPAYRPLSMRNWETGYGALRMDVAGQRPKFRNAISVPFCDLNGRFTNKKFRGHSATAHANYVGTWDLPRRVDVHPKMLIPTARDKNHAQHLRQTYESGIRALVPPLAQRICWCNMMKNNVKKKCHTHSIYDFCHRTAVVPQQSH